MKRALWIALLLSACHKPSADTRPIPPELIPPKRTMPPRSPMDEAAANEWDDDDTGGLGSIDTRDAAGDPGHLALASVHIEAQQAGDFARVSVEHHFTNESSVQLEGTFRFPLPDGAIVTGMAMLVGDKMIEGELVDSARARQIYQEIVDQMRDPVLMEWEHGSTFKMRVFPIEPSHEKVVTLRYLAPLRSRGEVMRFVQGTRAPNGEGSIAQLTIDWQGERVFDGKDVARGRVFEHKAEPAPMVMTELKGAGYTVVRVRPSWDKVAPAAPPPSRWVVVVDTSRSALEERKLSLQALRGVLEGLGKDQRFIVATSDLETRLDPAGWHKADKASVDAAVSFVEATEPDGATDLGAMLRTAGAAAQSNERTGVIYLGDCEPSWGETTPARLAEIAATALGTAPLYPLTIGDAVDSELARTLASATSGRMYRAQKPRDLGRFVAALHKGSKRLSRVTIDPLVDSSVFPDTPTTLDEGEELVAVVRTHLEGTSPTKLVVRGHSGDKEIVTTVPLQGTETPMLSRRYGAALVRSLEREGKPKADIVAASIEYTVMSKHTSFLVLDSEEAYQRYNIERRAKQANQADNALARLDTTVAPDASISAEHIQPGDPEIEIDAPRDAESVLVVLPNGDTKTAVWDDEAGKGHGAWMVRFLVDNDVPEGTYQARVFIEHKDGRHETRTVSYVVDTTAPSFDVKLRKLHGGTYLIDVKQLGARAEIDARRVEVYTPDGQTITLIPLRWGVFQGRWRPTRPVEGEKLRIVGVDEALNHTTLEVPVQ